MGYGCDWQMGRCKVEECTCGKCQRASASIDAFFAKRVVTAAAIAAGEVFVDAKKPAGEAQG
jgi:hypothetical protein